MHAQKIKPRVEKWALKMNVNWKANQMLLNKG